MVRDQRVSSAGKPSRTAAAMCAALDAAVLTVAGGDSNNEDALSKTRWFLIAENDNLADFADEEDVEAAAVVDPSNPPEKGTVIRGNQTTKCMPKRVPTVCFTVYMGIPILLYVSNECAPDNKPMTHIIKGRIKRVWMLSLMEIESECTKVLLVL